MGERGTGRKAGERQREGSALAEGSGACAQGLQRRKSEMPWPLRTSTPQGEK